MKLLPISRGKRFLLLALLLWLIAMEGPSLIHWAYRRQTTLTERKEKEARFEQLEREEIQRAYELPEAQAQSTLEERRKLHDWLHVRGWETSGCGDESLWYQPWQELFRYWMNPPLDEVANPRLK